MNRLVRSALAYAFQVTVAAVAATLPVVAYFLTLFVVESRATIVETIQATLFIGVGSLFVTWPFCFFVAAPIAIVVERYLPLTVVRACLLAFVMTVPGIVYLDYQNYLSSGPDSGPPIDPYRFLGFLWDSPSFDDILLMLIIPTASALFGSLSLYFLRFHEYPSDSPV